MCYPLTRGRECESVSKVVMSESVPHTDTGQSSDSSLAIALIGIVLVLGIFAVPWFFDGSGSEWVPWYRKQPPVLVEYTRRNVSGAQWPQQTYSDPPPPPYNDDQGFGTQMLSPVRDCPRTPNLSQLATVMS